MTNREAAKAPRNPTEAMLNAARDWSALFVGSPIGNKAATGCWQAMFDALPNDTDASAPSPTDEEIASAMVKAYLRTPASWSLLQSMIAVLAAAKPLIRQQMESRHE